MKLLALDLATNTGFAFGEHVVEPRFGLAKLPRRSGDLGAFLSAFDEWLNDFIDLEGPEWVVIEAPLMMHGPKSNLDTSRKLIGIASHVELVCHWRGIVVREANVNTVKKFWTHNGHAKKDEMVEAARRRGFATMDHNEADALAVWSYQVHGKFPDQRHRWDLGAIGARAA